MQACVDELKQHGHLVSITEEMDPYLEMAALHLRVYEAGGPALLFEKVKGSRYRAVSNLFGTVERSTFMFRDSIDKVRQLVALKGDPMVVLKEPWKYAGLPFFAVKALPKKVSGLPFDEIKVSEIPQIQCWPMDGGPFVTLPIVYTEDPDRPGPMNANIGMYRIQLGGNDYVQDQEVGLHYQLHRGIGVHQTKYNQRGEPMKVSVIVGGPPSYTFSAVMPLPEGLSEIPFAGALGNRRFRYNYDKEGFFVPAEADFVITGWVYPGENKPEGPFGDHLGYYSLRHDFPLMRIHKVYAKPNAIWPFTVVGRPPQEDTSFGNMIHEITGAAIPKEIPGLHEVHAVDAAGVHPLLLAIGSERYTPYYDYRRPQEILTIANHILGTGQLSLAKFLFITCKEDNPALHTHEEEAYYRHVFERIDLTRDVHFYTKTTIDTLDYSGTDLNSGSKVVFAVAGPVLRELSKEVPAVQTAVFESPKLILPGAVAVQGPKFSDYATAAKEMQTFVESVSASGLDLWKGIAMIVVCDDSEMVSERMHNFLWVTFTRANPSHDIYGVESFTEHKHWGCRGPLIIDARRKPHHAPVLEKDPAVEKAVDRLFAKGGSLHGKIKGL